MPNSKIKDVAIQLLRIVAIIVCLIFIIEHYFFEIAPFSVSPAFILSFLVLVAINWHTKTFQKKDCFKPTHIPLVLILLLLAVFFRAVVFWALCTFPLRDANTVLLTLQEPFDDFAYGMVKICLNTTVPQTLVITAILLVLLYTLLNSTKKRLIAIGAYFSAVIVQFVIVVPISDYIHILNNEPEKNAAYSRFFVENYANPDSIEITAPEHKRNLILIYLESLETTFSDKDHGGYQDSNLIPEITELALQNISFGKDKNHIGGGLDASGSNHTFGAFFTRSLGVPNITNYEKNPILYYYKSLYKILNSNGYKQIFVQGNPGLYRQFRDFANNQRINEIYGPDDLIQRLNLDTTVLLKNQGFKTVQDKETFKFVSQILDTISEPFTLTFFTIDTHGPQGLYDPDCIKSPDENNNDERLKATARCVSREIEKFLTSLKAKPFYDNTTIIIFGDHLFMGTRLVKGFQNRRWVDIFVNTPKDPFSEENRLFSDIDMFPTILSSINFGIDGDRLGLGADLFSDKKTLVERVGIDSLNKEIDKMSGHLIYESYLRQKRLKSK